MRVLLVCFALIIVLLTAPFASAQKVDLTIDPSKEGAKIDRNVFGQFAEHLGHGVYEGIWVGRDSPIPNTRGRGHPERCGAARRSEALSDGRHLNCASWSAINKPSPVLTLVHRSSFISATY